MRFAFSINRFPKFLLAVFFQHCTFLAETASDTDSLMMWADEIVTVDIPVREGIERKQRQHNDVRILLINVQHFFRDVVLCLFFSF